MNNIILIGRLATDIELRYTPDGKAVASFTLAVDDDYKKDYTHFFQIECWGKLAENCEKYIGKGRKAAIKGSLKQNRWENENGNKRSKNIVNASNVEFLDYKSDDQQDSQNNRKQQEDDDIEVPF